MPGAVPTSILKDERSPGIQPLAAEVSVYGIMQSVISPAAKYPAIQPPMPVQAGAVAELVPHGPAYM